MPYDHPLIGRDTAFDLPSDFSPPDPLERRSCSCLPATVEAGALHEPGCAYPIRSVNTREDDLKNGLLPVPFAVQIVGPGQTVTLEANPQVMLRGPYYVGVTAVGAPGDPVIVEDVRIGNQILSGCPGRSPMRHYVLDAERPWPEGLVPMNGPMRQRATKIYITVHNSSCDSREFFATIWGTQVRLDQPAAPRHPFRRQPSMDDHEGPFVAGFKNMTTVVGKLAVREPAPPSLPELVLRWFGLIPWDAEICAFDHAPLPPGECKRCGVRFQNTSQGLIIPEFRGGGLVATPYHKDCFASLRGLAFEALPGKTEDAPFLLLGGLTPKQYADQLVDEYKQGKTQASRAEAFLADRAATEKHLAEQAGLLDTADDAAWESPNDEWP